MTRLIEVSAEHLSERYRRLVEDVISRLPRDWNVAPKQPPKHVTFVESTERPALGGLAATEFREDSPYRRTVSNHTVTLYSRLLSECSDDAVRWVIAHELGHVISSHLHRFVNSEKAEGMADSLAVGWGFTEEWKVWAAAMGAVL